MSDCIAITGASSGLGRELTRKLSHGGSVVIAAARRAERLATLSEETGCLPVTLDVTDAAAVPGFVERLREEGCEGLILNAGVTYIERFLDKTDTDDAVLIATNVTANVVLLRAVCADWVARGVRGRILIVASLAGLVPVPYQSVYAGTKAFLVNFGLSLREEMAPHGIVVGVFCPGGIKTEMTDDARLEPLARGLAPVGKVADAALRAWEGGKALSVDGVANRAGMGLAKVLPRGVVAKLLGRAYAGVVE